MYHVAVVYGSNGVQLISVADSPEARERDVVEYVRSRSQRQLAPWTRDRVLALLERGATTDGVSAYFAAVGREWDYEWLHLQEVTGSRDFAGPGAG